VRLVSADGALVDLRLLRYQFPAGAGAGPGDWDANWLVVGGEVRLPDGRGWSFAEPCLTTREARSLGRWLRAVVAGEAQPADLGREEGAVAFFTEPNVAVSLAARSDGSAVIRVHLSLESRPPWLGRDVGVFDFFVTLDLPCPARPVRRGRHVGRRAVVVPGARMLRVGSRQRRARDSNPRWV
jgi:hypothetical protein